MEDAVEQSVVILIPAYNAESFIRDAINSSIKQTYLNSKLVIINDGSTDGTTNLLGEYVGNTNVQVISNESNKGKANSLNDYFAICDADYIALMDADDVMYPHRIERQVAFMEANKSVGVSSGFMDYIGANGKIIGQAKSDLLSSEVADDYAARDEPFAIFCPCAILRREVFTNPKLFFRGQFWPADDVDLWNRIYESGWGVVVQPEILMQYRIHGASAVTSDFLKTRRQFEFVRECMRARRRGEPEPSHDQFNQFLASRSLSKRIGSWRKIRAKAAYRSAGFSVAEGRRLLGAMRLVLAFILQPAYVVQRLRCQMLKK